MRDWVQSISAAACAADAAASVLPRKGTDLAVLSSVVAPGGENFTDRAPSSL